MQRRTLVMWLVLALGAPALAPVSDAVPEPAPPATLATPSPTSDPLLEELREPFRRHHTGLPAADVGRLVAAIAAESERYGIPPSLVLGVIQIESGFYNFAVSHKGAMGLMQLMPETGRSLAGQLGIPWRGPETLFDPLVNVRLGIHYLAWLEARFGRMEVALAAYNWGPGRIGRRLRGGAPLPRRYVDDVLDAYGAHAARSLAWPEATPATGVFTSAATKPSTAPIAASSPLR